MKGSFFDKALGFSLELAADTWHQGDSLKGSLSVSNALGEPVAHGLIKLCLAEAEAKKVKAKADDAFVVIQDQAYENSKSPTTLNYDFSFNLDQNCMVSEKSKSLYLVLKQDDLIIGHLQLPILPIKCVQDFITTLENFHRFKLKSHKNKKAGLDLEFLAPNSKEFGQVEKLSILPTLDENKILKLKFNFKVKKLSYEEQGVVAKSEKLIVDLTLTQRQYESYGEINQDGILKGIESVISDLQSKTKI